MGQTGSVVQIGWLSDRRYTRTDVSQDLGDGDAAGGVAVQNGHTNLELRHLTVEVWRHEALTRPFHTPFHTPFHAMHLGFDAAPAVVTAPSSPERAAQIF
jgi:hypothetical protein